MLPHDLLPLGAPVLAPIRDAIRPPRGPGTSIRNYELRTRIPCGRDDQCYLGVGKTAHFDSGALFIRRHPKVALAPEILAEFRRRSLPPVQGVEQLFAIGAEDDDRGIFVVSDAIHGASLRDLYVALHGRGELLPWRVAAVLAHDALVRLEALRAAGVVHPAITAPRLRISLWGGLWVCHGDLLLRPEPLWQDVVWAALRPIFALAADQHERVLLADLLAEPEPDALAVACDAIAERHPEVDPLLPLALVHRAEHAQLAPLVDRAAVRRLWDLVIELATR